MMGLLQAMALAVGASCAATGVSQEPAIDRGPLTVTITCRDNPDCVLTEEGIELEIVLRNSTTQPVAIPFAYINRTGPFVEFIDNSAPHRRNAGRISVPRPELLSQITHLAPGKSLSMSRHVNLGIVSEFNQDKLCFTAIVSLQAPDENLEDMITYGIGEVVICGKQR